MTNSADVVEVNVPSSEWDELVRFYSQLYGQPQERSASTVAFTSADADFELHLTRADEKDASDTKPPYYHIVRGSNGRQTLRRLFRDLLNSDKSAYSIQDPREVGPAGKEVTTAFIGYGDPCALIQERTDCLLHNPNW
ncbi:hypothetical protein [Hymenobacter sp. 5414T-23]|uniref:hypothetical protein n=1 Tax=Hymenobacter sp. 5414T-23 TaxID=2932252 RepID=UPI001FCFF80D|nr:hypothetical protein [Hymenobacter sp. 5414T-23]UOQ82461.1 hypothetical protein MUN83_06750 [Hymenobacter sp. 5414T-23]